MAAVIVSRAARGTSTGFDCLHGVIDPTRDAAAGRRCCRRTLFARFVLGAPEGSVRAVCFARRDVLDAGINGEGENLPIRAYARCACRSGGLTQGLTCRAQNKKVYDASVTTCFFLSAIKTEDCLASISPAPPSPLFLSRRNRNVPVSWNSEVLCSYVLQK